MPPENLIQLLQDPQYRKMYIKYKVRVEHKNIPKKLLEDLPRDTAWEILRQYYEERKNYLSKKTTQIQSR
ncbi:MAG: hypothetical protein KIH10_16315 [Candidatus Freyarchaeota archaeon]|nr:hypothetical protein [Candidatus Jordarchaeia archaeon]MBS7281150.1 hypothetical protein [Candidatus Jordarchaeia archaeon]